MKRPPQRNALWGLFILLRSLPAQENSQQKQDIKEKLLIPHNKWHLTGEFISGMVSYTSN